MTERKIDPAGQHFCCSKRERAAFEAGIKLGGLFHQYIGVPLSLENVDSLEKAIEEACSVQPFVKDITVRIDRSGLSEKEGVYDYTVLSGEMLEVLLHIVCAGVHVETRLEYVENLEYPLMWISKIEDELSENV